MQANGNDDSLLIIPISNMKFSLIYFIVLLTIFQSCEPYDIRLTLENETNDTLYAIISNSKSYLTDCFQCNFSKDKKAIQYTRELHPKQKIRIRNFGKKSWPLYVEKAGNGYMYLITFDKKTIMNNSWEKIYESKMELEIKKISLRDLNKKDWKLQIDN
ncbi:MAG: hypothetical protein V7655_02565 [Aequorivita antarctica]